MRIFNNILPWFILALILIVIIIDTLILSGFIAGVIVVALLMGLFGLIIRIFVRG